MTILRAIGPTETPLPPITHVCARCGQPLTPARAEDNAARHDCDGDYGWLRDA